MQNMYIQVGRGWALGTTNSFLKEKGFIPQRQHSRYFASAGILLLKSSDTFVYCLQKQNTHQPILIQPHCDPQRHITVLNLYKWLLHSAPSKNFLFADQYKVCLKRALSAFEKAFCTINGLQKQMLIKQAQVTLQKASKY